MNFEIKQSQCKFYVDKEHRKVICVIPKTKWIVDYFTERCNLMIVHTPSALLRDLEMPRSFRGVATCHAEDEFDEEMGKLIAYNKACHKLNVSIFKRLNIYLRALDKEMNAMIDECNAFGKRVERKENAREERIKKHFEG